MRIAVLSDIHGNKAAFDACINELEARKKDKKGVDHLIFLGDYITDGPFPEQTLDLLYQLKEQMPCTFIRGNREEYLLDNRKEDQGWKKCSANGSLFYTAEHMREKDFAFFESLPNHMILELSGIEPITVMHGSQFAVRDNYVHEPEKADASMKRATTRLLLGGHSHKQEIVQKFGRTYCNPGSVGLAIDGIGKHAEFAILSYEAGKVECEIELCSVPYDFDKYVTDMERSCMFDYAKMQARLMVLASQKGVNYFFKGVDKVEELCGQSALTASEEVWEEAYRIIKKEM